MSSLEKAIRIATEVHEGQLDKGGQPYILHCLRVMMKMETNEERIVAVLHDALEDFPLNITTKLWNAGFSESIVEALQALTRHKGESYDDYIKNLAPNKLAYKVKMADLGDNMNMSRIRNPTEEDYKRYEKYMRAQIYLMLFKDGLAK